MATTAAGKPRIKHRRRRVGIVIAIVVAALVAAFVIGDQVVKQYATNYLRQRIATSLDLPSAAPVRVDLGSGSILLQAAFGHINTVKVGVDPLVLSGLTGSAALTARDVPLSTTRPVPSLVVTVAVPASTVTEAISRLPALAPYHPQVKISGREVSVVGTLSIFGFAQHIGATLTPMVVKGKPSFRIDTATFNGATVSVAKVDAVIPGLASLLQSGATLCIADKLPRDLVLTDISVTGQSLVSTFDGHGIRLNAAALSEKGSCG